MATVFDIGALITHEPEIHGGRPIIAETGVTVQRIVVWYKLGLMPEEIAERIRPRSSSSPKGKSKNNP